jgi:mannose-1-phosphate guanylyltransferase
MQRSALILAGGRGERFWPWSVPGRPKQLLPLAGTRSMLEDTLSRLDGIVPAETTWVLTSHDLEAAVVGVVTGRARVLAEPCGRNTAPAIGLAALLAQAQGASGAMAVLPADHLVPDVDHFRADLAQAVALAEAGDELLTFGVRPTRAETGYGYIEVGAAFGATGAHRVHAFREKPDRPTAERWLKDGAHRWNSGIFAWRPSTILAALARHRPVLAQGLGALAPAAQAIVAGRADEGAALLAKGFPDLESISIDFAVLEHADNVVMIDASFDWDDLGSWIAWGRRQALDARGNVTQGRAAALDSDDCVVVAAGDRPVVVLGVKGLVVVQHEGGTLVCPAEKSDEVRKAVQEIERRGWSAPERKP